MNLLNLKASSKSPKVARSENSKKKINHTIYKCTTFELCVFSSVNTNYILMIYCILKF